MCWKKLCPENYILSEMEVLYKVDELKFFFFYLNFGDCRWYKLTGFLFSQAISK